MIIYMEMAGYEYSKDGNHFIIKMDASMEVKDSAGNTAADWLRLSEGGGGGANRCSACFSMENKGGFP